MRFCGDGDVRLEDWDVGRRRREVSERKWRLKLGESIAVWVLGFGMREAVKAHSILESARDLRIL